MPVALLVLLGACAHSRHGEPADHEVPNEVATVSAGQCDDIEGLIEQLAISQAPASRDPVYTPSADTPASDPRQRAFDSVARIKRCGRVAFPALLTHIGDRRQSIALCPKLPATVGLACFTIIEEMVYDWPEDYPGGYFRAGADGTEHAVPVFMAPGMFDMDTVAAWLEARKEKLLPEIQLEAVNWLIEQERAIGFPNDRIRAEVLGPLERQRDRLERHEVIDTAEARR